MFKEAPGSICVLRLSAVGDICHTVPVVRAIQRHWPDTRLTWVIGHLEASLVGDMPGVEFITFDKSRGFAALRFLKERMTGRRYDALLHMQIAIRASLASILIPADIRLGFDRERARDYQWLFTNRRIAARRQQHVMDGLLGFAAALGIDDLEPEWNLPLGEADRSFASEHLPDDRPSLVISPCSSQRFRNFRNWSAERYAAVADYAAEHHGARVILTGGPTDLEHEYGRAIRGHMRSDAVDLVGRTTLKQLAAVLERASVLVGPDSGPVHIANAVGTPVVGLYATSNPDRTGPYHSRHLVANRYPDALARELGKTPDAVRWGRRVRDPEAMTLIRVSDVTEKLDRALAERGTGRS